MTSGFGQRLYRRKNLRMVFIMALLLTDALEKVDIQTYAYGGMLTIYSEEPLYDLRIYDPAGRLLCMEADAGTSYTANLTAGTYIIRASGSTCKVIVP